MSRYIDGDNLMMSLTDWWYSSFGEEETEESKAIYEVMNQVEEAIKAMPSAHPEKVQFSREDTTSDCISRQAVIDLLLDKGMITAAIYVERIPSVQPEDRCGECDAWNQYKNYSRESHWIPCSEMFPELGLNVLVTTSWNFVTKAMFCGDHWEIESIDYKISSVVAWMVLPAPWKK